MRDQGSGGHKVCDPSLGLGVPWGPVGSVRAEPDRELEASMLLP